MHSLLKEENGVGALGLLSGGLDSQLAVRVLQRQGIMVRTVVFDSPFYSVGAAIQAAAALEVPLRIYDFTEDIIALLDNPPHGFGKCMNPCIDCHALMLRRAGGLLEEEGCRFLFTGEVLNERPMSQTRRAMRIVAAASDFGDLVLRPLSALALPPTKPEREGWVDRAQLLELSGRRRTAQFALAAEFGLVSYPSPAGGCLLTEPTFCARLQELREHEGVGDRVQVRRLRAGRHFRLSTGHKFVLGRDEADNAKLAATVTAGDAVLVLDGGRNGPTGLLPAAAGDDAFREAAAITAFYGKCPPAISTRIAVCRGPESMPPVDAVPMPSAQVDACRIG
jgi:tRNA-specific 2-thiouridylase